MLLDHDTYVHDAYICDIQSLTMLHVCMMRLKFPDGRTNKAILGVGCIMHIHMLLDHYEYVLDAYIFDPEACMYV